MKKANKHPFTVFIAVGLLSLSLFSCAGNSSAQSNAVEVKPDDSKPAEPIASQKEQEPQMQNTQIANPASTNCIDNGGKLEIQNGEGGQFGVCVFKDGSRCEEWHFLRKQCSPGSCRETSGICKDEQK
jgi:putative hemolysin